MTSEPATESNRAGRPRREKRPWPLWVHLLLALLLVALLRNFVVQSFYVPSSSMEHTLNVSDRVVVSKYTHDFQRGDVVVFDGTDTFGGGSEARFAGALGGVVNGVARVFGIRPGEKDYVKRIVGVGGDKVACCDTNGKITVNGTPIEEPYLGSGVAPSQTEFSVQVPANHFFMLGDNRDNSADSRAHLADPGGGMIAKDDVIGKPLLRYWPLDRLGGVDGGTNSKLAAVPGASGP